MIKPVSPPTEEPVSLEVMWDLYLDAFPCGCIRIPLPPPQEITFIKYKDSAGILQTLDPSARPD